MSKEELYAKIWKELSGFGFQKGDDVPYFHLHEACEYNNVDVDEIDIDDFSEKFGINIG